MDHSLFDNSLADGDDAAFDRLVDGELSADDRRSLLASLDGRSDGWRRCALAFLEAQSWRGEFGRMIEQTASAATVASLNSPARRGVRWGTMLATAAAVMAAFGLGWQLSGPQADDLNPAAADLLADAGAPVDDTPVADASPVVEPLPEGDAVTLLVRDRDGVAQRIEVPLVDGSGLGEQFADDPAWTNAEFRDQLARHGIDVQARRRYAPLFFEQEDQLVPMIVPVDDAVITPVSLPIY
jgi:hypothetical protein